MHQVWTSIIDFMFSRPLERWTHLEMQSPNNTYLTGFSFIWHFIFGGGGGGEGGRGRKSTSADIHFEWRGGAPSIPPLPFPPLPFLSLNCPLPACGVFLA